MSDRWARALRAGAVILMGFASVFTLLGGAGTACVAFSADSYGRAFAAFVPYMPVYQLFVYFNAVTGIAGIAVTYFLLRGRRRAHAVVLATLGLYIIAAGVQMWYSSVLRETSFFDTAPNSMRLYVYVLTLVVFIILKLPGVRDRVDFNVPWRNRKSRDSAGGVAAIFTGALMLATPFWAAANHAPYGENLIYVLAVPLAVVGSLLVLLGLGLLALSAMGISREQVSARFSRRTPRLSTRAE